MPITSETLLQKKSALKSWLFDKALPLWWEVGADHVRGGVHEKLGQDGHPTQDNRRTRVAARQVYAYALARRMGYEGETNAMIRHGLEWLSGPAATPDGLVTSVLTPDGEVIRAEFDFYDHAFTLLAYASAFHINPQDKSLEQKALIIRNKLLSTYKHPIRGFEESQPRSLPLKTNPHMHMFEATLAWIEAGGDQTWHQIAAEIAELCLDKFLHPQTGALGEYFDGDWNPLKGDAGRVIEPGHQFEWAWLLIRWAAISGDNRFIAPARRLVEIAETYGTDHTRNVTIFELWDDFSPKDEKARLWSQTERMKAYAALLSLTNSPRERDNLNHRLEDAMKGLQLFLNTKIPGLYLDRINPDGTLVDEPAPASTLYHIICAIDEVVRA
ncbi:MAG: AGE family epimerase/isomerase [Asticcacaulis sp.]